MSILDMAVICCEPPSMVVRIWSDRSYALVEENVEPINAQLDYIDIDLYDYDAVSSYLDQPLMNQIEETYFGPMMEQYSYIA